LQENGCADAGPVWCMARVDLEAVDALALVRGVVPMRVRAMRHVWR